MFFFDLIVVDSALGLVSETCKPPGCFQCLYGSRVNYMGSACFLSILFCRNNSGEFQFIGYRLGAKTISECSISAPSGP